jgi:hypothetical protein
MSTPQLPDDVRRWPRDPYQLLGLNPHCSALEARRAYTQLIRRFKPEQFPDHFRLIREAYEAIKQSVPFARPAGGEPVEEQGDPFPSQSRPDDAATTDLPRAAPALDLLQILWNKACNGQEQSAYLELRRMYEIHPHGSELAARLYALLLASPDLDPRRTPCDWLERGVRSEGPWGPCRQLYRREIDDHPEEALSDRFAGFLEAAAAMPGIVEVLQWRWQALEKLARTELIAEDLRRLAPRLEHGDEENWVRVLLRAADYTAWRPTKLFDRLRKEIEGHVHVHNVLSEELSRLDYLRALSGSWLKLMSKKTDSTPFMKVIPLSWTNPYENRQRILQECRVVADAPESALNRLDAVNRTAPLIAAHLAQNAGLVVVRGFGAARGRQASLGGQRRPGRPGLAGERGRLPPVSPQSLALLHSRGHCPGSGGRPFGPALDDQRLFHDCRRLAAAGGLLGTSLDLGLSHAAALAPR